MHLIQEQGCLYAKPTAVFKDALMADGKFSTVRKAFPGMKALEQFHLIFFFNKKLMIAMHAKWLPYEIIKPTSKWSC